MNKKIIITVAIVFGTIALFLLAPKPAAQIPSQNNIPRDNIGNSSTTTPTNTNGTVVTSKLGQTITFAGVSGTLKEVVEDSRCPVGVQCIQAGTVKVKVRFSYGSLAQDLTLGLNQPFTMYGYTTTLISVKPEKTASVNIAPSDYVFTFLIK